jgi:hypothetical protein
MSKKKNLSPKYQIWVDARVNYKLTHVQIQMARELGYNPKMLKKIYDDDTLKLPLHLHIEAEYKEKFKRDKPEKVYSIEDLFEEVKRKSVERKDKK